MARTIGRHGGEESPEAMYEALDWEALLAAVRDEPDLDRVAVAWWVAIGRVGIRGGHSTQTLMLPEALDEAQRRLAEALAARDEVDVVSWGIPGTKRLLLRWLGRTAPTVLERPITVVRDGATVTLPVWKAWETAPDELTEYGQGVASDVAAQLTGPELIEAAGEALLEEGYSLPYPLEARVRQALDAHAAEAVPWARRFLADLVQLSGGRPLDTVPGYSVATHATATAIGTLALLPMVRAGVPLDPAWDLFVPHDGDAETVRTLLMALPPERREAVVWHRLSTTWGSRGDQCINGFEANLRAAELAPSERTFGFVVRQYGNCRRHFAKSREKILARFDAIVAAHPALASVYAPKKPATKKKPSAKKPSAKKKPAARD